LDPTPILLFVLFVLLLAFFAGTEIPLMSVTSHKLDSFIRQKRWGARTLSKLKKQNERLLITNLIGTLFVTSAPMIIAEKYITPELVAIFGSHPETTSLLVYISAFMIVLLFGEITSKILGVRFNDTIALRAAPIYQFIIWLLLPITWCVEVFVKILGWVTGGKLNMHSQGVTDEELDAFIDMSHEGGAVEDDEKKQIKNLLGLSEMTAESVMTPRVNVEFIDIDMSVDSVCEMMMQASHSRFPVAGDTTDDVEYVLTFREAFKLQREGHGDATIRSLSLEKIMKIPLTQPLDDLFEKFQKSHRHIALVLDEHGGTAGIITMEDVLEEVFGDIKDEKDKEDIYMRKNGSNKIEAIGTVLIDDILEEFNVHPTDIGLPESYNSEPLSYIILSEEEEFPAVGTIVTFSHEGLSLALRVMEVDDNVIGKVECEYSERKE
jgi:putative hemolysin